MLTKKGRERAREKERKKKAKQTDLEGENTIVMTVSNCIWSGS